MRTLRAVLALCFVWFAALPSVAGTWSLPRARAGEYITFAWTSTDAGDQDATDVRSCAYLSFSAVSAGGSPSLTGYLVDTATTATSSGTQIVTVTGTGRTGSEVGPLGPKFLRFNVGTAASGGTVEVRCGGYASSRRPSGTLNYAESAVDYVGDLETGILYNANTQTLTLYNDRCDLLTRPVLDSTGASPADADIVAHIGGRSPNVLFTDGYDFGPGRICWGIFPYSSAVSPASNTHINPLGADADTNWTSGHNITYVFHQGSYVPLSMTGQTEPWLFAKFGNRFFAGQNFGQLNERVRFFGELTVNTGSGVYGLTSLTASAGGTTGAGTLPDCGTVEDSGAGWTTNQWQGWRYRATGGTGSGGTVAITANDADTLTIACMSRGIIDATGDSATTTSVTDDDKSWHTNELATTYRVRWISGCAAASTRQIASNTERTLTWSSALGCTPAAGDEWVVELDAAPDATTVYSIEWPRQRVNQLNSATIFDSPYTVVGWWNDNMTRSNHVDFRVTIEGNNDDNDNKGVEHDYAWGNDYHGWRIKNQGIAFHQYGNFVGSFQAGYISANAMGLVLADQATFDLPFYTSCVSGTCTALAQNAPAAHGAFKDTVIEGNGYGNIVAHRMNQYQFDHVWTEGVAWILATPQTNEMFFDLVSIGTGRAGAADFFGVCGTPGNNNPVDSPAQTIGRPGEVPLSLTCTPPATTAITSATFIGGSLGNDRGHEIWDAIHLAVGFSRGGDAVSINSFIGSSEDGGATSASSDAVDDAGVYNLTGKFYFRCAESLVNSSATIILDGSQLGGGTSAGVKYPNCGGIESENKVRLHFGMNQSTAPTTGTNGDCLFAGGPPATATAALSCSAANIGTNGGQNTWPLRKRMLLKRATFVRTDNTNWSTSPEDSINLRVREWYCSAEDGNGQCTTWTQSQFVFGPLVLGAYDIGRPVSTSLTRLGIVGPLGNAFTGDGTSCGNTAVLADECQSMIGVAIDGVTDTAGANNVFKLSGYIELIPPLTSTENPNGGANP
jgi:hypothetical protein